MPPTFLTAPHRLLLSRWRARSFFCSLGFDLFPPHLKFRVCTRSCRTLSGTTQDILREWIPGLPDLVEARQHKSGHAWGGGPQKYCLLAFIKPGETRLHALHTTNGQVETRLQTNIKASCFPIDGLSNYGTGSATNLPTLLPP